MAPKILLTDNPLSAMDIARELAPSGFDLVIARANTPEFNAALADTDFIVGLGEVKMDDAFYKSAPKLKLVQLLSAGYDRVDIEAARRAGVPVCNNGGANAIAVTVGSLHRWHQRRIGAFDPADAGGLPPADLAAFDGGVRSLAWQRRGQRAAV